MFKICDLCKRKFGTDDKDRRFCSRQHYYKYLKKKSKEKWDDILIKVHNEHWETNQTIEKLCQKYNLNRNTILNKFNEIGMKVRNRSEATNLKNKQMTTEQKKKQTKAANKARYSGATDKNFRTRVFKFYPNVCVMCGEKEIKRLNAHHIIPIKRNKAGYPTGEGDHRVRNGMIVCTKCHSLIHNNKRNN